MILNYMILVNGMDDIFSTKFVEEMKKKIPKNISIIREQIPNSDKYMVTISPFSKSQSDYLVKVWSKVMPENFIIKMEIIK